MFTEFFLKRQKKTHFLFFLTAFLQPGDNKKYWDTYPWGKECKSGKKNVDPRLEQMRIHKRNKNKDPITDIFFDK